MFVDILMKEVENTQPLEDFNILRNNLLSALSEVTFRTIILSKNNRK